MKEENWASEKLAWASKTEELFALHSNLEFCLLFQLMDAC